MANARKTSIHHQIMMRRASRSEYNDGLLRHNQRQENRLVLELEQWDKAQRLVAKGLDRESQLFKQNVSSSGYNPQRNVKRNSLTEFSGDPNSIQSPLVPDYQYRNRATVMAEAVSGHPNDEDEQNPANTHENDGEKKRTDQTDSAPKAHKKHSRAEREEKKSSSKDGDRRKSSKHHGERESREKQDVDKPASENSSVEKKTSKTAPETSTTSKKAHDTQGTPDKPSLRKTSTTKITRKQGLDHILLPSNVITITTTNTTTTTTTATTTQTATDTTKSESSSKTPAVSVTPRPFNISEDVHDPGDVTTSPRLLQDLGWDGRRRYTNVWDSLSAPKRTSQIRSVRSRLQREFTQVQASEGSNPKGTASARKSSRTYSLT